MRTIAMIALMVAALDALAQALAPLPPRLSGRWTVMAPRGAIIDAFQIDFEGDRAAPTVQGRLSWRGFNCGASDEPVQVSWNGAEARFQAVLRPNVNTQRMNGPCTADPIQFVLRRKPGGESFEGEATGGGNTATMTATP